MKKLMALLLTLAMIFSLAACGGKEAAGNTDNTNAPSQPQSGDNKDDASANSGKEQAGDYDLTTVEGLLASYGFSTEDFEATKDFDRIDVSSENLSTGEISGVAICATKAKTADEMNEWKEMFVDLIRSASDDGKAYGYSFTKGLTDEEFTAESFENSDFVGYLYKGKVVVISASFFPNDLDGFALLEFDYAN